MFYKILRPYLNTTSQHQLKRGQIIYHEADIPKSLYLIDQGIVGLFHISETGHETFLRVFNKDDIFGHRSYFAQTPYHATAIALTPVVISTISSQQCSQICQEQPELLKEMTKSLAIDLGEAELRLSGLQDKNVSTRVIETLVFLKLKHPEHTWTRKEIAEYSGSTLETVTRVMTMLDQEGLIQKEGRDFNILDHEKLIDFSKQV